MTTTNSFQDTIKAYLDKRAEEDTLFAATYAKENKNIKDCCSYITSQAKKQASNGCAAISDDVVFGWAVHYYDEDDIKIESPSNTKVPTARPTNKKAEVKDEDAKMKSKTKSKLNIIESPNLFDELS